MFKYITPFMYICLSVLVLSCSTINKYFEIKKTEVKRSKFIPIWIKNNDPEHESGNLPIALNSPLIFKNMLYIGNNNGRFEAYELESGRVVWSKKDKGEYHGAPIIYKKQVIYGTTQGRVYSRDYLTGKIKYSVDLGSSIETAGVLYKGRIFFHTRNHKIFCLDVATGKFIWAYKRAIPHLTTLQRASKPIVYKNKLYVGFADGYIAVFSIEEGALLWEKKLSDANKFLDVDSSPVIIGGKLYIGSMAGSLNILDSETGRVVKVLPYIVSRAPYVRKDKLFFGTVDGKLIVIDKNSDEVIFEKQFSKKTISSVVFWKDYIALSTVNGRLYLINYYSYDILEHFDFGHLYSSVFGELVSFDKYLAVLSSRNRLYTFKQ